MGGTEGGLIALPLLQGTPRRLGLRQSSSCKNAFGQNCSAISFSKEVQQDTGISEWSFSQTVVFLLGETCSIVWGKWCKQQHRFASPQLQAGSNCAIGCVWGAVVY